MVDRSFTWSECNYMISENTDISTVCWQSARGIYSKVYRICSSMSIYVGSYFPDVPFRSF